MYKFDHTDKELEEYRKIMKEKNPFNETSRCMRENSIQDSSYSYSA